MKKICYCLLNFLIVGILGFSLVYYPASITDENTARTTALTYIIWAVITVIIGFLLGLLEFKIHYYEKFFAAVSRNRKSILRTGIMLGASALLSALTEMLLCWISGTPSTGFFDRYRFFFITAVLFVLFYLVYHTVKKQLKTENTFAVIALAAGFVMIFSSPFGHTCWDSETHYIIALSQSSANSNITQAYESVRQISENYTPRATAAENEANIKAVNEQDKIPGGTIEPNRSLAHLPAAISLAFGRLFGLSFYTKECLAKFANLLIYTAVCFFAIRKLKSGKIIFFILALIPTNMFVAANITYDWCVNCFTLLGMAYFLSEMQQPSKKISTWETVVMCGGFVLACLPKQVYFPILALPFFMRKTYFKTQKSEAKKYRFICTAAIIGLIISFILRTVFEFGKGGDMRGGADVSATGQILFILGSPFKYMGILLKFLWGYVSLDNIYHATCDFCSLGTVSGYTLLILMLLSAVLTDKNEYDFYTSTAKVKTAVAVIAALGFVLVPTALYIAFTPVGLDTINGCQARYMTPLFIAVFPFIGSGKFTNRMDRNTYDALFAFGMSAVLFIGIYEAMICRML